MAQKFDVIVLGAGAAGMMCAIRAGQRGRSVLLLDHAKAPGEKIRISGGGRCNFTNIDAAPSITSPTMRISPNRHLPATRPRFPRLVERHRIPWHEKTLGQLFCDNSAKDIIAMLLAEMSAAKVSLKLQTAIDGIEKSPDGYRLATSAGQFEAGSLVVATGASPSRRWARPASPIEIAEQFGLKLVETRPGLVPLTFDQNALEKLSPLSGIAVPAEVRHGRTGFRGGHAVYPSRPQWPVDPADFLLLAGR